MELKLICFTILVIYVQVKSCFGQEALEVNTDYADYKVLNDGQELELTCKNNVDNTQAVTWETPNNVPYDAYTLDIKDGKYTLTFKNAKREYAGKYTCKSHTRNGDLLTKDVHVGVQPKINKLLVDGKDSVQDEVFSFSESATIECIDDSMTYPKAIFVWKKNGKRLEYDESNKMTVNENGKYACEGVNSIGSSAERSVTINVIKTEYIGEFLVEKSKTNNAVKIMYHSKYNNITDIIYTWKKNNIELTGLEFKKSEINVEIEEYDVNYYTCVLSDPKGRTVISNTIAVFSQTNTTELLPPKHDTVEIVMMITIISLVLSVVCLMVYIVWNFWKRKNLQMTDLKKIELEEVKHDESEYKDSDANKPRHARKMPEYMDMDTEHPSDLPDRPAVYDETRVDDNEEDKGKEEDGGKEEDRGKEEDGGNKDDEDKEEDEDNEEDDEDKEEDYLEPRPPAPPYYYVYMHLHPNFRFKNIRGVIKRNSL